MTVLSYQKVEAVWTNYQPGNAYVWFTSVGAWRKIRGDSEFGVTDILTLAAAACANGKYVHAEIDDATGLVQWMVLIPGN